MPKVYEYRGIGFYIFPGDHEPSHVHVMKQGWFRISIEIETNDYKIIFAEKRIPFKLIKILIEIIQTNRDYFIIKWKKYGSNKNTKQ